LPETLRQCGNSDVTNRHDPVALAERQQCHCSVRNGDKAKPPGWHLPAALLCGPRRRTSGLVAERLLTRDEARHLAASVAKLPDLWRKN
jgi:hypothetical protein